MTCYWAFSFSYRFSTKNRRLINTIVNYDVFYNCDYISPNFVYSYPLSEYLKILSYDDEKISLRIVYFINSFLLFCYHFIILKRYTISRLQAKLVNCEIFDYFAYIYRTCDYCSIKKRGNKRERWQINKSKIFKVNFKKQRV